MTAAPNHMPATASKGQMQADDTAAIELAVAGNEDGFRLLLDRHGRAVYQLAFRITGRREDAEDVVQETFIKAFRQIERFEARSSVSTWLYRIGANCAIDMLRRRRSRERSEEPAVLDMRAANDPAPSALSLVEADEIRQRIDDAMSTLSARERAAFVMRHFQECSIDEIGSALGMNTGAAKHAVFRAVRKMRTALGRFVDGPHD